MPRINFAWIVAAMFVVALVLDQTQVRYMPATDGRNASIVTGLVAVLIILGVGRLFWSFTRWWRRDFHPRMTRPRR